MIGVKRTARASTVIATKRYSQLLYKHLLDHFVFIERQREPFSTSRQVFHDYSHMRILAFDHVGVKKSA